MSSPAATCPPALRKRTFCGGLSVSLWEGREFQARKLFRIQFRATYNALVNVFPCCDLSPRPQETHFLRGIVGVFVEALGLLSFFPR